MGRFGVVLVALALVAVGGVADAKPKLKAAREDAPRPGPVVVAVIDTGINAYHEVFRGGPSFADVAGFPADATRIDLAFTAPSWSAAVAADAAELDAIDVGELAWFPGTRLAAVAFDAPAEGRILLDHLDHGTKTAHAVRRAAPDVAIVMLQVADDESIAPAMRWAAAQPWIDVVSVSWGKSLNEYAEETMMGLADAYREAARAGKIVVNAAGNEPVPHVLDEHSGPPFVIAVGGAFEWDHGDVITTARSPDFVSVFSDWLAHSRRMHGEGSVSGTSFSAPVVAGVLAQALHLVRAQGEDASAGELRRALERRAELWAPQSWVFSNRDLGTAPVVARAPQMGWGYVDYGVSGDVAAHVLGDATLPPKPLDVVLYMGARQAARAAMWGTA